MLLFFQLMSEIKFHLTVHTPWRALEGLLIDIKTRFASSDPDAVEALRLAVTVKPNREDIFQKADLRGD